MGFSIVYNVRDIFFKILIKCPMCHTDLRPKKRIEDKKSKIQSTEIERSREIEPFRNNIKEYVQVCPKCRFKMHYINCIPIEKDIREIKDLNRIENKKYIGVN